MLTNAISLLTFIIVSLFVNNLRSETSEKWRIMTRFLQEIGPMENFSDMRYDERIKTVVKKIKQNEFMRNYVLKEAEELGFLNRVKDDTVFPCKPYEVATHGTNKDNLLPGDISVIAAIGDSLTAGLGIDATSVLGLLTENKGKVYDIGGQVNTLTMTNFLRVYNPNIKGFSMINSTIHDETDHLNVAVSGATAEDIENQADLLISRMKADPSINMTEDWKLITILIGNNDICRWAELWNRKDFSVDLFKQRMRSTLDKLQANIPRAFVNIVTMLDVSEVHNMNIGVACSVLHLVSCPAVAYAFNIEKIVQINTQLQNSMYDIVKDGRYDTRDDFTVVVQPFFQKTYLPLIDGKVDLSYFAPDCFHLSEKGHGQVALSLWNGIFDKVGEKRETWHAGELFDCPNETNPYLATANNSK